MSTPSADVSLGSSPFGSGVGRRIALVVSHSLPCFVLATGGARAQAQTAVARACSDGRLVVDGSLSEPWPGAVAQLCESLADIPDLDPDVAIRIVAAGDDVIVEASLPDGRTATTPRTQAARAREHGRGARARTAVTSAARSTADRGAAARSCPRERPAPSSARHRARRRARCTYRRGPDVPLDRALCVRARCIPALG